AWGNIITSAAGPLSNVCLAVLSAVIYGVLLRARSLGAGVEEFLAIMMQINVSLFLFNFLPVPPLDGGRVADGFMPYRYRPQWEQFLRVSPFVLLLVIYFAGSILRVPMQYVMGMMKRVIALAAGV